MEGLYTGRQGLTSGILTGGAKKKNVSNLCHNSKTRVKEMSDVLN